MTPEPQSVCFNPDCRDVAHVVLYASADRLCGQTTRERQPVAFCLRCGGQVYDVMRAWKPLSGKSLERRWSTCPAWLAADLKTGRLPRTSPDPKGWPAASPIALSTYKRTKR